MQHGSQPTLSAIDVAEYVLQRLGPVGGLKLQKLIYFIQGHHLAEHGQPLISERLEAWPDGPVVYDLWCRHGGSTYIRTVDGDAKRLGEAESTFVDEVLDYYGHQSGFWLRDKSHEQQPWLSARRGLAKEAKSKREVTRESMREFFTNRPWGGAEPLTDFSVFSRDQVDRAMEAAAQGRTISLEELERALSDSDS